MADEKNIQVEVENNGEKIEKVSFKDRVKAKAGEFSEKHPKATKVIKTTGKVVLGAGLVVGGVLAGNAMAQSKNDSDADVHIYISGPTEDDVDCDEATE